MEQYQQYHNKISILLHDVSTKVLRRLLLKCSGGDLHLFLSSKQTEIFKLKLIPYQKKAIISADCEKMDISLLCLLLEKVCTLSDDLKSSIKCLREMRNKLSHPRKSSMTESKFEKHWNKLKLTIKQIAEELNDETLNTELEQDFSRLETSTAATDVYSNMKKQTKAFLQAGKSEDFLVTKKIQKAKDQLESGKFLMVIGSAGDGKTSALQYLANHLVELLGKSYDRCALLHSPEEWKCVDINTTAVILLDDVFGRHGLDRERLLAWRRILDISQGYIRQRNIYMILTSRKYIFKSAEIEIEKIVKTDDVVDLSESMTDEEKKDLIKQVLKKHNRDESGLSINDCITAKAKIGFPYCVQMFAANDHLFEKKEAFFQNPHEYFKEELEHMREKNKLQYITMLYIFYEKNNLDEDGINVLKMTDSQNSTLQRIAKMAAVSEDLSIIISKVVETVACLTDIYVVHRNGRYSFIHDTMYEMVAVQHSKQFMEEVLERCTTDYLCQCVTTDRTSDRHQLFVEEKFYKSLAQRMISEVSGGGMSPVIGQHQSLENERFATELRKSLTQDNMMPFYTADVSFAVSGIHGFIFHALSNRKVTQNFINDALSQLSCNQEAVDESHRRGCWKCKVKTEIMMGACAGKHIDILESLLEQNIEVRTICLFYAVQSQASTDLVEVLVKALKERNKLSSHDYCISYAIALAFSRADKTVFDILKANGIRMSSKSLYALVDNRNDEAVEKLARELKSQDIWLTDDIHILRGLTTAYTLTDKTLYNLLIHEGLTLQPVCLYWAVLLHTHEDVKSLISDLKAMGSWDSENEGTVCAYGVARFKPNPNTAKLLLSEGATIGPSALWWVVNSGQSSSYVELTLTELKESGNIKNEEYNELAVVRARSLPNDTTYQILKNAGLQVSTKCLNLAMKTNGIDYLHDMLTDITEDGTWDPNDWYVARAITATYAFKDDCSREVFASKGAVLSSKCIYWAVKDHPPHVVSTIIRCLSEQESVPRDSTYEFNLSRAFVETIAMSFLEKKSILVQHGAKVDTACLYWAVFEQNKEVLVQILEDQDQALIREQQDEHCSRAIVHAISKCDNEKIEILQHACLKITPDCRRLASEEYDREVVDKIDGFLTGNGS